MPKRLAREKSISIKISAETLFGYMNQNLIAVTYIVNIKIDFCRESRPRFNFNKVAIVSGIVKISLGVVSAIPVYLIDIDVQLVTVLETPGESHSGGIGVFIQSEKILDSVGCTQPLFRTTGAQARRDRRHDRIQADAEFHRASPFVF